MANLNQYQLEKYRAILDEALERKKILIPFERKKDALHLRFRLYNIRTTERKLNNSIAQSVDEHSADLTSVYDPLVLRIIEYDSNFALSIDYEDETELGLTILDGDSFEEINVGLGLEDL